MVAFFWFPLKSKKSSVGYFTRVHSKVTFYKVPETHGHVQLVTPYNIANLSHIFWFPCSWFI